MIVLDTSVLVGALTAPQASLPRLTGLIDRGARILIPAIVLFEWLRGPRSSRELEFQESLFPEAASLPFGWEEAAAAARLYQRVARPRGREIDLAIAAHAVVTSAELWTLNERDFENLPGVRLLATQ